MPRSTKAYFPTGSLLKKCLPSKHSCFEISSSWFQCLSRIAVWGGQILKAVFPTLFSQSKKKPWYGKRWQTSDVKVQLHRHRPYCPKTRSPKQRGTVEKQPEAQSMKCHGGMHCRACPGWSQLPPHPSELRVSRMGVMHPSDLLQLTVSTCHKSTAPPPTLICARRPGHSNPMNMWAASF